MKLTGKNMPPGEWAFKALIRHPRSGSKAWNLTPNFYFTREELLPDFEGWEIKWPVEEYEGGMVYVPTEEELKE